jgi:hypothetical protein
MVIHLNKKHFVDNLRVGPLLANPWLRTVSKTAHRG